MADPTVAAETCVALGQCLRLSRALPQAFMVRTMREI